MQSASRPSVLLAIEASNPVHGGGVALATLDPPGGPRILAREMLPADSPHVDTLMPAVAAACRSAGIRPFDLSRVAVSIGPGGYTSLRTSVTAARLIAASTGAACIAVPTSLPVIRRVDAAAHARSTVIVCLAWKRHDVWRQVFAPGALEPAGPGALVPVDRLIEEAAHAGAMLVADHELVSQLRDRGLESARISHAAPVFDPVAVAEAAALITPVDPLHLHPLYPREPEAVSKWRSLGRAAPPPA